MSPGYACDARETVRLEEILSTRRYLAGDRVTLSDVRVFPSLVRFDEVYSVYFKCNKKRLVDYPNVLNYVRDLYQRYPVGFADTTNMDHIRVRALSRARFFFWRGISLSLIFSRFLRKLVTRASTSVDASEQTIQNMIYRDPKIRFCVTRGRADPTLPCLPLSPIQLIRNIFSCDLIPASSLPTLPFCLFPACLVLRQKHYYTSHAALNTYSIIPVGPDFVSTLKEPHDRDRTF